MKVIKKLTIILLVLSIQFISTHVYFMSEPEEYSNDVVVKTAPVHHAPVCSHDKSHVDCQTISSANPVEIGRTNREVVHHFFESRSVQREKTLFKQRARSSIVSPFYCSVIIL